MARYLRFRVELERIQPAIWRRFLLPAASSFADLHAAIQASCGWQDCHLYTFLEAGVHRTELVARASRGAEPSWSTTPLAPWFAAGERSRRKCVYWYDFGDDWFHEVELEGYEEHPEDHGRRLLGGARSFPPEDCGGLPGHERCLRVLGLSRTSGLAGLDDDDAGLLKWLGGWEPERFDLDAARQHFERPRLEQMLRGRGTPRWLSANLRDFVDSQGLPRADSGPARKLARRLAQIVMAASSHAPGDRITTALRCMRRPGRRRCAGHIAVGRESECGDIEWGCSVCSDGGVITGWSGGAHDLSGLDAASGEYALSVRIPAAVHGALLDERALVSAPQRLLYSARASAGQVTLQGTLDEFEELYEASCDNARHASRGVFKQRLELACELLGPVVETAPEKESVEDEWAVVVNATRGMVLTSEQLAGLRSLVRETRSLVSGVAFELGDLMASTIRDSGGVLTLEREIRGVLSASPVDYRHVPIFIRLLESTLERLGAFARESPTSCHGLYRQFLLGVGEVAAQIDADENDLAEFNEQLAWAALELARKGRQPSSRLRPLLSELLNLWLADDCCAFHFVPALVIESGLGKQERGWLLRELERRSGDLREERPAWLEEFGNWFA